MALLTGEARYSDLIERTLYNGFLAGVSLDGERWLYVNPLQVRDGHTDPGGDQSARRTRWFRCACCPPNVMRLPASLPHYLATTDDDGLQIHQYVTGRYLGDGVAVRRATGHPWHGTLAFTVEESPADRPWTLSLRIPRWCRDVRVRCGEEAYDGPVAIERGPLVYCLEQADHPGGGLDDIVVDTTRPLAVRHRPDLLGGVTTVGATGHRRCVPQPGWWPFTPYPEAAQVARAAQETQGDPVELTAVPIGVHGKLMRRLPADLRDRTERSPGVPVPPLARRLSKGR